MAKLSVNAATGTTITNVLTALEDAMAEGVEGGVSINVLAPPGGYASATNDLKNRIKDGLRLGYSALVKHLVGTWQTVAVFSNSWTTGSVSVKYRHETGDMVRLSGSVISGSTGTVAFTLPVGFRPAFIRKYAVVDGTSLGIVSIATNGEVTVTGSGEVWLDNVVFTLT